MRNVKFVIGLFSSYLIENGNKKIYKTIDNGITVVFLGVNQK